MTQYLVEKHDVALFCPVGNVFSMDAVEFEKKNGEMVSVPVYPGTGGDMYGEEVFSYHYDDFNADIMLQLADIWMLNKIPEMARSGKIIWIPYVPVDYLDPIPKKVLDTLRSAFKVVPWCDDAYNRLVAAGLSNVLPPIPLGLNCKLWVPLEEFPSDKGRPAEKRDFPETMKAMGYEEDTFNILIANANQFFRKCLMAGSKVHTYDAVRNIEDIVVGDRVLTHKGRYRVIEEVSKVPFNGTLVKITPMYFNMAVEMTDDHPVLAIKRRHINNLTNFKPRRELIKDNKGFWKSNQAMWIKSRDLEKGDYLVMPRVLESHDAHVLHISDYLNAFEFVRVGDGKIRTLKKSGRSRVPFGPHIDDNIVVDENFMRLCGYYLAEGYSIERKGISFSFHEKEIDSYVADIGEIIGNNGLSLHIYHGRGHGINATIYSSVINLFFLGLFGTGARHKCLPGWFLGLPDHKLWALVKGMWRGDGTTRNDRFKYTTSSQFLAYQLFLIFTKLGVPASLQHRFIKYRGGFKDTYEFTIAGKGANIFAEKMGVPFSPKKKFGYNRGWIDEKYFYMPIRKIERRPSDGELAYNIEVNEDKSFASSFVVHNSYAESLSGIAMFRDRRPDAKVRLYLHTPVSSADGWNMPELVETYGLTEITKGMDTYQFILGKYDQSTMVKIFALSTCVINCLPPYARVVCNFGPKRIGWVKPGTQVMTHAGTFRPVKRVFKRPFDGRLIRVSARYSCSATVTPEHPLLVYRNGTTEWVQAKDIRPGDFAVVPKPRPRGRSRRTLYMTRDRRGWRLQRLLIDSDLMRFFGYYVAEGSASEKGVIKLALNISEMDIANDIKAIVWKKFKRQAGEVIDQKRNSRVVQFTHKALASLLKHKLFGKESRKKHLPHWFIHIYDDKRKLLPELLKGLWAGDGCWVKEGAIYSTSSRRLAEQVRLLLMRYSYLPTFRYNGKRHEYSISVTGRQAYRFAKLLGIRRKVCGKTTFNLFKNRRGYFLVPIKEIKEMPYKGFVYNLEVVGDNSYTTPIAVHNCGLEGFGYASLQSQAVGVPCIGLNAGPTPEIVKYGVLVEPRTQLMTPSLQVNAFPHAKDIADALETIYDNPSSKFSQQRRETIDWVRKTFDWDVVMKKWDSHLSLIEEELYRKCIWKNPPKPSERSLAMAEEIRVID